MLGFSRRLWYDEPVRQRASRQAANELAFRVSPDVSANAPWKITKPFVYFGKFPWFMLDYKHPTPRPAREIANLLQDPAITADEAASLRIELQNQQNQPDTLDSVVWMSGGRRMINHRSGYAVLLETPGNILWEWAKLENIPESILRDMMDPLIAQGISEGKTHQDAEGYAHQRMWQLVCEELISIWVAKYFDPMEDGYEIIPTLYAHCISPFWPTMRNSPSQMQCVLRTLMELDYPVFTARPWIEMCMFHMCERIQQASVAELVPAMYDLKWNPETLEYSVVRPDGFSWRANELTDVRQWITLYRSWKVFGSTETVKPLGHLSDYIRAYVPAHPALLHFANVLGTAKCDVAATLNSMGSVAYALLNRAYSQDSAIASSKELPGFELGYHLAIVPPELYIPQRQFQFPEAVKTALAKLVSRMWFKKPHNYYSVFKSLPLMVIAVGDVFPYKNEQARLDQEADFPWLYNSMRQVYGILTTGTMIQATTAREKCVLMAMEVLAKKQEYRTPKERFKPLYQAFAKYYQAMWDRVVPNTESYCNNSTPEMFVETMLKLFEGGVISLKGVSAANPRVRAAFTQCLNSPARFNILYIFLPPINEGTDLIRL